MLCVLNKLPSMQDALKECLCLNAIYASMCARGICKLVCARDGERCKCCTYAGGGDTTICCLFLGTEGATILAALQGRSRVRVLHEPHD